MVTMTFVTDAGPLDVSRVPDGTTGFGDLIGAGRSSPSMTGPFR
jgi:hypothetical protein